MKFLLPIILLFLIVISVGCVSDNKRNLTSIQMTPTPIMKQIPTDSIQTATPISTTDALCGELVYCGYAPAGFETQPIKSTRCEQLYKLRMQNDQKVMQCLKNPYEVSGNNALMVQHCNQGIGTVDDCAKVGVKLDRDNGNVIEKNFSYLMGK
jgi:hypothetical protein